MTDQLITVHQVTSATWHLAEPLVRKWLRSKHCPHTPQELLANLEAGDWTLWAVVAGRHVTGLYAVRTYMTAKGKCLEMPFLVGDKVRQWWRVADDAIEQLARAEGCNHVVLTGRKGWERITRGRYRVHQVVIAREVGHG